MEKDGYLVLGDLEETLNLKDGCVEAKGTLRYFLYDSGEYSGFLRDKKSGFEVLVKGKASVEEAAVLMRASKENAQVRLRGHIDRLKLAGLVSTGKRKMIQAHHFKCRYYKTSGFDIPIKTKPDY